MSKNRTEQEATMTSTTTLIADLKDAGIIGAPRERTDWMFWLADHSRRFLSIRDNTVTLWQWHAPFSPTSQPKPNTRLASMPLEQATAETVACLI